MFYPARSKRTDRRGGILATAMLFFVMVTVAGTAILSMSTIQRLKTVRNGIDVRLMIACEAAVESVRGRFTLIKGVQDDWSWVSDTTWTSLGVVTVNGINVNIAALRFGGDSVPRARVRANATASGKTRWVEYTVKVASFSDYSVFASNGNFGANYKLVGNYYSNGNINVDVTGCRVFGETTSTGIITGAYSNPASPEYPFVNSNPLTNQPAIPFPVDPTEWDYLKNIASTTGYVYAENTMEIIFNGTTFTRWYVRRKNTAAAGVGTVPTGQVAASGSSWINSSTGVMNYTNTSAANPYVVTVDYEWVSETLPIPNEGVIYVQSGAASGITMGPLVGAPYFRDNLAASPRTNGFVQQHWLNTYGHTGTFTNQGGYGVAAGSTPVLVISGTLDNSRVSLVCDHRIIVRQPIAYQGNLDNPTNRRFFNDGASGKQSPSALNMVEMLGVMGRTEICPCPLWWQPLPSSAWVTGNAAGETLPGHDWSDTVNGYNSDYSMDGVYLAMAHIRPRVYYNGQPMGELWYCGGLICQGDYGGGNGNNYSRRNYDWDYRMDQTMPPYFLRAYNTTAKFVPGSWRTWES